MYTGPGSCAPFPPQVLQIQDHDFPPQVLQIQDHECCRDRLRVVILMEIAKCDLQNFLVEHKWDLDAGLMCRLFRGMVEAVTTLHARGVVHFDLKPQNFLLVVGGGEGADFVVPGDLGSRSDEEWSSPGEQHSKKLQLVTIKIGDFGLARRLLDEETHFSDDLAPGTTVFMAPEALYQPAADPASVIPALRPVGGAEELLPTGERRPPAAPPAGRKKLTPKLDIWALGVMLYKLLHGGKTPWDGHRRLGKMELALAISDPRTGVHFYRQSAKDRQLELAQRAGAGAGASMEQSSSPNTYTFAGDGGRGHQPGEELDKRRGSVLVTTASTTGVSPPPRGPPLSTPAPLSSRASRGPVRCPEELLPSPPEQEVPSSARGTTPPSPGTREETANKQEPLRPLVNFSLHIAHSAMRRCATPSHTAHDARRSTGKQQDQHVVSRACWLHTRLRLAFLFRMCERCLEFDVERRVTAGELLALCEKEASCGAAEIFRAVGAGAAPSRTDHCLETLMLWPRSDEDEQTVVEALLREIVGDEELQERQGEKERDHDRSLAKEQVSTEALLPGRGGGSGSFYFSCAKKFYWRC